ncbi:hypothetical protein J7E99_35585 [Streptomyces sp. ISL-44]|uniref:hypothetical protein n=1 Tax=Streptomyces sp. ISL-44 TaxID=2819184 RepID=UPI001BEA7394|nr:hypothetical protein [Streptomyces sp. ISL-44]MBT2545849.1 hypothetical protein [Streptomyces sp. ISL-44]
MAKAPTAEVLRSLPGVEEAEVAVAVGATPPWQRGTHGGTVARLFATATTAEQLVDLSDVLHGDQYFGYAANSPAGACDQLGPALERLVGEDHR